MNSAVVPTKVLSDPMELERTLQSGLMQSAAAANATNGGYPFDSVSMAAAAAAANGGLVPTTAAAVASEPSAAVSCQGRQRRFILTR